LRSSAVLRPPAFLFILCMLFGSASSDELPTPSKRLTLAPSPLPGLLEHLPKDDHGRRWELANVALEVLIETYRQALLDSTRDPARSNRARQKLARWQRATSALVTEFEYYRQQLLIGGDFSVFADARGQVFVTVEGQPLALTGAGRDDDRQVQAAIVERFCSFNDCPQVTDPAPPLDAAVPTGTWQIRQGQPPVFDVDPLLRCRFSDLSRRREKAIACRGAAIDIVRLEQALAAASAQNQPIEWDVLAASRRQQAGAVRLILNASGVFATLELDYLGRLDAAEWTRLVDHLRQRRAAESPPMFQTDGEALAR
jgi:hypothetical protein